MIRRIFLTALLALLPNIASADVLFPSLGAAGAVAGTNIIACYQGTEPALGCTVAQILTYIQTNIAIATANINANAVTLAKQATNTANTLQGFDNSGNAADVAVGTGLTLSGGTLTASGGSSTGFGVDGGTAAVSLTASCVLGTGASCSSHSIRQVKIGAGWATGTITLDSIANVSSDTCVRINDSNVNGASVGGGSNISGSATLTVTANAADGINGGSGGSSVGPFTTGGLGLAFCVSGTHNWNAYVVTTIPTPGANQVATSNGSSQFTWSTALPSGTTATTQSANDNSTKVATTAYADTSAGTRVSLSATGQSFTGGIIPTAFSNGTASSGTKTIDCGVGPIQTVTNGGAFTLAMATNDGSCVLRVTNNASAGAITFSGFSEGSNTGDALTTTNTNKFDITLTRIGGSPHYLISALQ